MDVFLKKFGRKVGSPFLVGRGGAVKGAKGPGGIVNVPVGNGVDGGGDGDNTRKKPRSEGKTQQQQQQQQQQQPPPPSATATAMATLQTTHAVQSQNPYQHIQQPYVQQQQIVNQPQTQRSTTLGPDRSIITAAGGIAAIGGPSQVDKLPADTGKLSYVSL
jgi:chromatin structure-remodeling complex subunit RSC1/2